MSKTPYEIRAEILQLAKSYLDAQFDTQRDLAFRSLDVMAGAGKLVDPNEWKKHIPEMYSIDELIKKSQELYTFVSKKDPTA